MHGVGFLVFGLLSQLGPLSLFRGLPFFIFFLFYLDLVNCSPFPFSVCFFFSFFFFFFFFFKIVKKG